MQTKPKGRYTTRDQIVSDIDKWETKAKNNMLRAARLYESAKDMRVEANKKKSHEAAYRLINSAKNADAEGDGKVETAARIRGGKLRQLSDKLAEFDTMVLPGMGSDISVEGVK